MTEATKLEEEIRHFCCLCFADDKGGSWGEGTHPTAGWCANCGAGGSLIAIQAWAVASIRKNGSWVCKRYYPAEEDKETLAELKALRALVTEFPGRSVQRMPPPEDEPARNASQFMVIQQLGGGRSTSMWFDAATSEEALEKARPHLPYVPKEELGA